MPFGGKSKSNGDYGPNKRIGCFWEVNKGRLIAAGYLNIEELRQLYNDWPDQIKKEDKSIRIGIFEVKNKKNEKSPAFSLLFMTEEKETAQKEEKAPQEDAPF